MLHADRLLPFLCAGFLAGFLSGCNEKPKPVLAPPTVLVAEVGVEDVPILKDWVGSIEGAQNTQIEARVSGYLLSQEYKEGDMVQAGAVLFRIDSRPYEASLAQAKANLAQAQAKAALAKITLTRQTELFKTNVISAQQYDVSNQDAQAAYAVVQSAEAALETAQLNLDYCTIIAPFEGIAGKAQAQLGDLVGTGASAVLTTLSQIQPVKVNLFLSEQEYLFAVNHLAAAMATPIEQRRRSLQIYLSNGDLYPHKGVFDFINRQIDPRTGTIQVVSLFSNPDYILRPGQYAKVQVLVETLQNAIVIPQRAVTEIQGSYYQVAVVGADNTVKITSITPGPRFKSNWVITAGLQKGDRIVVEGGQKLRNGMKVEAKPYIPAPTPTPSPTPTPRPIPTPTKPLPPTATTVFPPTQEATPIATPPPAGKSKPAASPTPKKP